MHKDKLIKLLADQIGVEPDDLNEEDSLREELHMGAEAITDFTETLANNGYDTEKLDFAEIQTVADLLEHFSV